MAAADQVKEAIGCLSTVFPQFVAKELAKLVDDITASVQGFTDPLAAIADLNIDSLLDDVAKISEGDVFDNLGSAAIGLAAQHTQRELSGMVSAMSQADNLSSLSKRVNDVRNLSEQVVTGAAAMMSLYSDMPYAIAQKICSTIIELNDMKIRSLSCMRKHIVQVVNAVVVLAKNVDTYADDTFADLDKVLALLTEADLELTKSQRLVGSQIIFDSSAFIRAQDAVSKIGLLLTPDKDGTSILDAASIVTFGSVGKAQTNTANQKLVTIVIPSLTNLLEAEAAAFVSQVEVINHHISSLGTLISEYRNTGITSRVQEQRARIIADIKSRLSDLDGRITLAVERRSLRAASAEMLLWSSRIKAILVMMDRVRELTLQEGSPEGPDKAFALEQAFQQLLTDLTDINNDVTLVGIEDPLVLRSQVLAITKAVKRIVKDIEEGRATETRIKNLHTLAESAAISQLSNTDDSTQVAIQQQSACATFAAIDIGTSKHLDSLLDSMRQLNLDRGVALLSSGALNEFFSSGLDSLSFLGAAANCLTTALEGIDDTQTRQQITDIRDDMVSRRISQDIASADSADQGRTRFIDSAKESIATIQRNAQTVEAIVADLKALLERAGESLDESLGQFTAFLSDLDHLQVNAGGRLGSALEEYSDHPNAGVVSCEL